MFSSRHSRNTQPRRHRRGFALLITITLLAFLVLLLVSLASLTRVETQVANNNQQIGQARQNALMALNIALGQLQKYAGPDQRVTARSDMDATLANTATASGRWTGVYGQVVATAATTARDVYADTPSAIADDVAANSAANGNQAQLLNWLVSGNEGTVFNPVTAIDANGRIIRSAAPTSFVFSPGGAVNLPGGANALSTDVTVADAAGAKPARLLVGPNSAGTPSDYVAAPLMDIQVAPAVVPGAGGADPITVGRYAWWVGDEGIKARVNLRLSAATPEEKANAFVSSQRAAVELLDGKNATGATTLSADDMIGPAYAPAHANLGHVMAPDQLPLLAPAGATALATAGRHRFHDLTGYSTSVLSDTYAGGLKKDLSAFLAEGVAGPADTDFIFPPEPNTASSPTNEYGLPTWGTLRSYVQTTAPASGALAPRPRTMASQAVAPYTTPIPASVPVAPVLTYGTLGFQYAAPAGDVTGAPIQLAVFPVVVLWNPYTTDIAPARYEFGARMAYGSLIELQSRPSGSTAAWSSAHRVETRDLGREGRTVGSGSSSYFRFVIDNSEGLRAGQSLVFTLQTNGNPYVAADTNNMLKATDYNPLGHVLVPSTRTITATNSTYRVGVDGTGVNPSGQRTFFYNTSINMGRGNSWHEAYLGRSPAGSAPSGAYPYLTSGSTFTSQEVYQMFSLCSQVSTAPPYGNFPGGGGYPVANVQTGLIQNEGPLTVVTSPTFRMTVRAQFTSGDSSLSRSRWIAMNNITGLVTSGIPVGGANGSVRVYAGRSTQTTWPPDLGVSVTPDGVRASSGSSLTDTATGAVDATLYEFRPAGQPLLSLGQLQHANMAWSNGYPSYAIGNSLAPFTPADRVVYLTGAPSGVNQPMARISAFYDLSWLLNRALWDRYFVSTIPYKGSGTDADTNGTDIPDTLPNPRHLFLGVDPDDADARAKLDADRAAAHLLLAGGFNVNSTSEQAWRAVLGGMNGLAHDPTGGEVGGPASPDAVVSRFTRPLTNATGATWRGYRRLSPGQVTQLAADIVAEIRRRGPFISMSDFVNRRLVATGAFPQADDPRFKGVLQAALDTTTSGPNAVNDAAASFADNTTTYRTPFQGASMMVIGSNGSTPSAITMGGAAIKAPVSATSAFAPQYVTQADILSAIGPGLSARSDTFTVRAYGEAVNPALGVADAGYITGRAWCEAVVQRLPDYVDSAADADAHAAPAASINKTLGRRFKIISFRWLSSHDI